MSIANHPRRCHFLACGLAGLFALTGCQPAGSGPQLGPVGQMERRTHPDPVKPLPGPESAEVPPPPFADVPLVYQRPPEQKMFLDGYAAVGRPRLAVFVNRSLLGDALPVEASAVADRVPPSGVDPIVGNPFRDESGKPVTYLRSGQYDEAYAKQIDYATIENVMTQWLACEGQTTIASPSVVRERLNADEINKLQGGRTRQVGELAKELNADILVYAQARPSRQTEHGLEIRLNVEAINIAQGEQIARATVLIPPPLDTEQVNKYTRFIARKLMADMAMTWSGPGPARHQVEVRPTTPQPLPDPQPVPVDPNRQPVAPQINPAQIKPAEINPAEIKPADKPVEPRTPNDRPGVPAEKQSVLDRPEPPSATRQPEEEFPPPPASARRMPE